MEYIKKSVLIEYLINEMDDLEPQEEIYKYYYYQFLKLLKLSTEISITNNKIKTNFINLLNNTDSYEIIQFMKIHQFYGSIDLIESSLNRKLISYEYECPISK